MGSPMLQRGPEVPRTEYVTKAAVCIWGSADFSAETGVISAMRFTRPRAFRAAATILCLSTVAAACPTNAPVRVPLGNWGGLHAGMVVADSGADVEFDCAAGR